MEEIPGSGYSLLSLPVPLCNSHRPFPSVCLSQTHCVKLVKLTSPSAHLLRRGKSFFTQEDLWIKFSLGVTFDPLLFSPAHLPISFCHFLFHSSLCEPQSGGVIPAQMHTVTGSLTGSSLMLSPHLNTGLWISASLSVHECHRFACARPLGKQWCLSGHSDTHAHWTH